MVAWLFTFNFNNNFKKTCWQVLPGKAILVKNILDFFTVHMEKTLKFVFWFTEHQGYTERSRDYRGKEGRLCVYTYPI
jgi:hypothetical protein